MAGSAGRAETGKGSPPRAWVKPAASQFRIGEGDDVIYSWAFLVRPHKDRFAPRSLPRDA